MPTDPPNLIYALSGIQTPFRHLHNSATCLHKDFQTLSTKLNKSHPHKKDALETPSGVPPDVPSEAKEEIEEKQIQERVNIGAHVVHETIRREGEDELKRPSSALAWSGLAAGLSMGFSLVAEGLLAAGLPRAPWATLISKLGYSVGFLIVVLGRQQLYTETTLTAVLPLLSRRNMRTALSVLRLWGIVLLANLVGTYLFALAIGRVSIFSPQVHQMFAEVSSSSTVGGFWVVFARAVFAGWLIALMVWLLPGAESSRVSIIIIITYLIGLGGFNHVIAGSTKVLFLVVTGAETWSNFFLRFFLPTFLGNMAGGVSLVAFLGHAQVVAGND
ncbi:MAG TPA: formate/nitrite transporter family protein [Candidatus Acidoferrales bacterium]|jgi:formate/nitrite transporter FocA (FNT family)|nr:formate/nitrite transporter family protein [Candidatus Acidoferrales bacterium]